MARTIRSFLYRRLWLAALAALLVNWLGCSQFIKVASGVRASGDKRQGITYYIGGAGPIGNVGWLDVPDGLTDAGYQGYVDVFVWQGFTHAGDQINLSRNHDKGSELATEIRQYKRSYPTREINIIALSAGTGVATFALEALPEGVKVDNVIFLGCSLSSQYNLTRALKRVRGGLYVIYSETDRILKDVVWYTGTVDRSSAASGVAGLEGFRLPSHPGPDSEMQYMKLHNVAYRPEFAEAGYKGGHIDTTSRAFICQYLAPVLMGREQILLGDPGRPEHERERTTSSLAPGRPPAPRVAPAHSSSGR
ncbi:MAG TPA: hypothetical protein VMV94_04350 [Phycisphaerae bacterium]|nr:hypothetical protein [Phycisphaerae bacterium]